MFLGPPKFSVTNKINFTGFKVRAEYSNSACDEVKEVGAAPSPPTQPASFPNSKEECGEKVLVTATALRSVFPPLECQFNGTLPLILNKLYIRPEWTGPFIKCIISMYDLTRYEKN